MARKAGSPIRTNIICILAALKKANGYQIYKVYKQLYAPCSLRVIYYHLQRGVQYGLFVIDSVVETKGSYSWGTTSQQAFYRLEPSVKPATILSEHHVQSLLYDQRDVKKPQ
jgi:hypothetical protein